MQLTAQPLDSALANRRRKRRRWPWVFVIPSVVYICYAAVMYCGQDAALFPGVKLRRPPNSGPGAPGVQQVWLDTSDGGRVEGWYQEGAGCTPASPGPALMYFHGNYVLVDGSWWVAGHAVPAGMSTLVMEYRGYGRCGGQPSQAAIVADAVQFYDWLAARPEVDPTRIAFQGASLGGAVATALAEQRRPAALVLECTFTSMAALAHAYGLPGFLCRDPFDTESVLPILHVPTAIFHGGEDHTIPVDHGRRLHALVPGSRYMELPCGHDDFHNDWANVRAFLKDVGLLRQASAPGLART